MNRMLIRRYGLCRALRHFCVCKNEILCTDHAAPPAWESRRCLLPRLRTCCASLGPQVVSFRSFLPRERRAAPRGRPGSLFVSFPSPARRPPPWPVRRLPGTRRRRADGPTPCRALAAGGAARGKYDMMKTCRGGGPRRAGTRQHEQTPQPSAAEGEAAQAHGIVGRMCGVGFRLGPYARFNARFASPSRPRVPSPRAARTGRRPDELQLARPAVGRTGRPPPDRDRVLGPRHDATRVTTRRLLSGSGKYSK